MQNVQTHIDIDAPASLVWAILADFGRYSRWNPLIRSVLGHPRAGALIEMQVGSQRGGELRMRATVLRASEPRELRWCERWTMPGLFSSERRFRIEPLERGGVRLHHSEQTRGIMVPFLFHRSQVRGQRGIDAMNTALKQRAERASLPGNAAPAGQGSL